MRGPTTPLELANPGSTRCILAGVVGLRRDIGVIVVGVAVVAGGCGGPLDSPDPAVVRDAAVDVGRDLSRDRGGAGGYRTDGGERDAPDDGGVDAPWPVIPGCVTGLPPQPTLTAAADGGVVVIGCAEVTRTVAWLGDSSHHGLFITMTIDPPLPGVYLSYSNTLCADQAETPIYLGVSAPSGLAPGERFSTILRTQVLGPPNVAINQAVRVDMLVAPIDFSLNTDLVDFGDVPLGESRSVTVMATNSPASAPFFNLYAIPSAAGPFYVTGPTMGPGPQPVLEPGASLPLLTVSMYANLTGSFQSSFLVSPFIPRGAIDPSCGVIRSLTVRAHIIVPDAGVTRDGRPPVDARMLPDGGSSPDASIPPDANADISADWQTGD